MNELDLNLDDGILINYKIGTPIPSTFNNRNFTQLNNGFSINVDDNAIASLFVCFRTGYENFQEFRGTVTVNNEKYTIQSNTTYEEITKILGEPSDTWNDGVEQCATFVKSEIVIEVIWHVDVFQSLDYISIELN